MQRYKRIISLLMIGAVGCLLIGEIFDSAIVRWIAEVALVGYVIYIGCYGVIRRNIRYDRVDAHIVSTALAQVDKILACEAHTIQQELVRVDLLLKESVAVLTDRLRTVSQCVNEIQTHQTNAVRQLDELSQQLPDLLQLIEQVSADSLSTTEPLHTNMDAKLAVVNHTLKRLEQLDSSVASPIPSHHTSESIDTLAVSDNTVLLQAINDSIQALQFEDLTSQSLASLQDSLASYDAVIACLHAVYTSDAQQMERCLEKLGHTCSDLCEQSVAREAQRKVQQTQMDAGDVELF